MSFNVIRTCRGCWRIVSSQSNTQPVCTTCAGFNRIFESTATHEWIAFSIDVKPMLWSLFPHSDIKFGFDTNVGLTHDNQFVLFDVFIPEYRLLIDFISDDQLLMPSDDTASETDRNLYMQIFDLKEEFTKQNNLRYVTIQRDVDVARSELINVINEVYVLDSGNGIQILHPKLQGDAGWDLVCDQDTECPPHVGTDIPSQVFLEIPNHLYAIVQARSSTSKRRLLVLPGVIDPGYRGQIFTMTFNPTGETVHIKKGDRISQLLFFYRVPHLHINPVRELRASQRGSAGFGSTG